MEDHPIQGLMVTAMENLKEMVDVNKVVGDPVETPDGTVIIPVCKVSFGFAAGGSQFSKSDDKKENNISKEEQSYPFGGGSGGGVSVHPMAFLIVGNGQVRLLPANNNALYDRLLDTAPQLFEQIKGMFKKNNNNNNQQVQQAVTSV